MGKQVWVCNECGTESLGYFGQCQSCGAWGALEKHVVEKKKKSIEIKTKHSLFVNAEDEILNLDEIEEESINRLSTGSLEFNRVLGGGIVPGSVNLVGGQPGIGKSTILLQLAFYASSQNLKVLYVSAEESSAQLKLRAKRLSSNIEDDENDEIIAPQQPQPRWENILVYTESNLEKILEAIKVKEADLVIVDSIQAIYNPNLDSIPGTISQIRESCSNLVRTAKVFNIPVFIVGHINKDGDIAGPKILEHMVDTVLQFEIIKDESLRILRSIKNRFGSTDELAVFEMAESGLHDISDPSQIFLEQRSGGVVTALKEGRRPILVEIQSLVISSDYHNPRRMANGVDYSRLHQILAVMEKHLKLALAKSDIYVNVAGGLNIKEPSSDLAIALSIFLNSQSFDEIPGDFLALGELGLSGEVRQVSNLELRLKEAAKLGFKKVLLPKLKKEIKVNLLDTGLELIECSSIKQAVFFVKQLCTKKEAVKKNDKRKEELAAF